jgi:hypothetical protein
MGLLRRLYAGLRLRVNEAKSTVDRPQNRKLLGYSFWSGGCGPACPVVWQGSRGD